MPKHVDHIIDGTELITLKRWGNTRQDVLVSLDDVNASGVISNFANSNLTFTGNRSHDTNGNSFTLSTDGALLNQFYIYGDTSYCEFAFDNNYIQFFNNGIEMRCGNNKIFDSTTSEATFNGTGANIDFRVEGQTDVNLFFVEASTDRVGIGTNTPASKFHVYTATGSNLPRIQTGDTSTTGVEFRNTANNWRIAGNSSSQFIISDLTTSGTIFSVTGGAPTNSLNLNTSEVVINNNAANLDTRIEGQTDANLFFADASTDRVGIGTNTPSQKLHVYDSGSTRIKLESGSNRAVLDIDSDTGFDSAVFFTEAGAVKWSVFSDASSSADFRIYNTTTASNAIYIDRTNNNLGLSKTSASYKLDVNGDINVASGSAYYHNGTAGLSGTYTFGGGSTGDIASMTFNGGILTAVTTVP